MAATSNPQRPWEMDTSPSSSPPPKNQLPSISALTGELPPPTTNAQSGISSPASTRERDSGAWSSRPQSTQSYSTTTSSYHHSAHNSSYYASPHRQSTLSNTSGYGQQPSHASTDYSINSNSTSGVGSPGFSNSSQLPSINKFHDPNANRQSTNSDFPPQGSRRSSIGSQMNQGMNSLHINGQNSPYSGSVNHSATSLAQNLQRERGLRPAKSVAAMESTPLSPTAEGRPSTSFGGPRVAPPIGRNPRSDVYSANEPVPGQAYAFPDADEMPSKRHYSASEEVKPQLQRRDSGHNSISSSVITSDSRLPIGQQRLEESQSPDSKSRHLSGEGLDGESAQPYSRTPALRVSHKMAERKRRSEMKDLFENLRSQIPSSQGSKSSKWEILTKASEYIKQLEVAAQNSHTADKQLRLACHDVDITRRENDSLRNENQRLLQELQLMRQSGQTPQASHQHPPPPPQQQGQGPQEHPGAPTQHNSAYASQFTGPPTSAPDPSRSLPPLTGANNSGSMEGVRYTN